MTNLAIHPIKLYKTLLRRALTLPDGNSAPEARKAPRRGFLFHSPVAPAMAGESTAGPCLTDSTVPAVANFNSAALTPADAADASTSPPALVSAATPSEPCALPPCSQALAADALATPASAALSSELACRSSGLLVADDRPRNPSLGTGQGSQAPISSCMSLNANTSDGQTRFDGSPGQQRPSPNLAIENVLRMRSLPYAAVNDRRFILDEEQFFRALQYVEFEREHEISNLLDPLGDA